MARTAAPAGPDGMSSAGGSGTSALPVLLVATMMIRATPLPALLTTPGGTGVVTRPQEAGAGLTAGPG